MPGSAVEQLYLLENNIGDAGIIALAEILRHTNILVLSLIKNNITDAGAQTLYNIYRSNHLQALYLYNNNVSSQILSEIESFQWQTYCQDGLCHADAQYNSGNDFQSQLVLKKKALRHQKSKGTDLLDHVYWPSTVEASSFHPALTLSNTTTEFPSSLHTSIRVGGTILSMIGFSILLYKNSTWIHFFANLGNRFLQQCWNSKKQKKLKRQLSLLLIIADMLCSRIYLFPPRNKLKLVLLVHSVVAH